METIPDTIDYKALAQNVRIWSSELGFQATGITDTGLEEHDARLQEWLSKGYHGEMDYMSRHGSKRSHPEALIPGTLRIISVRMDYLPPDTSDPQEILDNPDSGYISRYALGRDYHKVMRNKLRG